MAELEVIAPSGPQSISEEGQFGLQLISSFGLSLLGRGGHLEQPSCEMHIDNKNHRSASPRSCPDLRLESGNWSKILVSLSCIWRIPLSNFEKGVGRQIQRHSAPSGPFSSLLFSVFFSFFFSVLCFSFQVSFFKAVPDLGKMWWKEGAKTSMFENGRSTRLVIPLVMPRKS